MLGDWQAENYKSSKTDAAHPSTIVPQVDAIPQTSSAKARLLLREMLQSSVNWQDLMQNILQKPRESFRVSAEGT